MNSVGKKSHIYVILLILIASALYFPGLNIRDLWNPNEPGFGEVVREMEESKDFIVPTRNGEPLGWKPAPYYWLIYASSFVTGGLNEAATRLPSALFGLFLVVLTFIFARRFMEDEFAFISALFLATSFKFMWQARWAEPDIVLSFFIGLSLVFFYLGIKAIEGGRRKGTKRILFLLGYAAAGFATMSKGLVGFVVIGVVIFSYLLFTRRFRKLPAMEIILGPLVFFAVVLPWYIAAGIHGGSDYLYELVVRQNFTRYVDAFNHQKPFFYYFGAIMGDFAPASFFLPGAIIYAFKTKRKGAQELAFIITWFLAIFIFFSISDSKRELYILPLYPVAAIMVGWMIRDWIKDEGLPWYQGTRWFWADLPAWVITTALGITLIGAILFLIDPGGIFDKPYAKLSEYGVDRGIVLTMALPMIVILILGTGSMTATLLTGKRRLFVYSTLILMAIMMLYTQLSVLKTINPYKSPRAISEEIVSLLGPDDGFGAYSPPDGGFYWDGYLFYTEMLMDIFDNPEELKEYYGGDRRVIVIMRNRHFDGLPEDVRDATYVIKEFKVGHKEFFMTSNELF